MTDLTGSFMKASPGTDHSEALNDPTYAKCSLYDVDAFRVKNRSNDFNKFK